MIGGREWIDVVEAAYRLDLSDDEWTQNIADTVAPSWNRGFGVLCYLYEVSDGRFTMRSIGMAEVPDTVRGSLIEALEATPPELYLPMLLNPRPYGLLSAMRGMEPMIEALNAGERYGGVRDSNGLVARSQWDRGVVLGANLPARETQPRGELRRLASISAHLEAGYRLRRALTGRPSLDDAEVEAVLSPDGEVVHADGTAAPESARDALREAARQIDRARGELRRSDPDESLSLWRGLVEGRWSLVDHFDNDGRRFIVARKNPARVRDPRNLTAREAQVAHHVGLGKTSAEVAYAMGLSERTVRNHLSQAMAKLGLKRRVDLVREASAPFREALMTIGGDELVIRSASLLLSAYESIETITAAESEVLALLVEGLTNREIGARRGVAERTVANQVASLLRKLGAGTREELVRIVLRGDRPTEAGPN